MKNRKGEIATLLTLGLVLVGGLVTLATSFIVNRQNNLASNPRAGGPTLNCRFAPTQLAQCVQCGYGGECEKCSSGFYRCLGTVDDSITSAPKTSPTPTKGVGSGNNWPRDPAQGYNKTLCPKDNLDFACCVQDKFLCDGDDRFRWYGCTGQPCGNTRISQSNGPGHLVACPSGVGPANVESCAAALTPAAGSKNGPCIEQDQGSREVDRYTCNYPLICSSQTRSGTCISKAPTSRPSATRTPTRILTPTPRRNSTPIPTIVGYNPYIGATTPANGGNSGGSLTALTPGIGSGNPTPTVDPSNADYYKDGKLTVLLNIIGDVPDEIREARNPGVIKAVLKDTGYYGAGAISGTSYVNPNRDINNLATYERLRRFSNIGNSSVKIIYNLTVTYGIQSLIIYQNNNISFRADEFEKTITVPLDLSANDKTINFTYKNENCNVGFRVVKNSLVVDGKRYSWPENNLKIPLGQSKSEPYVVNSSNNTPSIKIDTFCDTDSGSEFLQITSSITNNSVEIRH